LISIAAVSIYGAHPIFWAGPSSFFQGAGAAASIALVSSIGVSSGMITPWIIGQIKTYTGSMDYAFYFVAVLLLASAVVMNRILRNAG
jgi:MFS-type transporter involved in bile tolerance (Atg22 family)